MNWRHTAISGIVSIPVIALLAFGMTRDPREIPSPLPGREAPAFALPIVPADDATPVRDTARLAAHRGQVVVLNFWASWCLACRSEHAALSETAVAYREQGVEFYGLLYKDSPANGRRWISEMGGQSYPTLLDRSSRVAIDYGLYGVPETFVIAPDGRVARKFVGPVTRAGLSAAIDSVLAATPAMAAAPPAAPAGAQP